MLKKWIFFILLYAGLFGFLFFTNPRSMPLVLLVVPFVWIYLAIFIASYYFIHRVVGWAAQRSISRRKSLAGASLCAFVPTSILILKSINQLTVRDIVIVSIFGLIMAFYINRLKFVNSAV